MGASGTGKRKPGWVAIIGALLAIGYVISMFDGSSSKSDGYVAESACKNWVREQLKAPATADFGGEGISGSGPWTITGYVDAENSFGAKIRTNWTCDVRRIGDSYRGNATLLD